MKLNLEGFYYTYVLRSLKDYKFYIGVTNNLERRLEEHLKKRIGGLEGVG